MICGYSTVLYDWATQIAPICNARDCGRMEQLLELASAWQRKAKIRTMPFINLVRAKHVENPSTSPIKVMSIHKSKGLEFDIVVLPELEAKLTGTRTPKVVAGRETHTSPVSTVLAYPAKEIRRYLPENFQVIAEKSETERVEESLCVLYVAMTRAKHELLMILMPKEESATTKKSNSNDDDGKKFAKTMAGVVHAGLAADQSLAAEDVVLYKNGDSGWATKHFASVLEEPPKVSTDSRVEEPNVTIKLASKSKKSLKNLTRMTPSGQASGFGLQASDQETTNNITYPLATDHWPLTTNRPSPQTWGTAMHACFEQVTWFEQGLPDRAMLLDLVMPIMRDAVSAERVVDAFYASCELPEVRAALSLATYRDAVPEADLANMRWEVHNERRFWASPKSDILLQGSIDRLVLQYDHSGPKPQVVAADVIDYKSGMVENDEMLGTLVEYYAPQLVEYRKAIVAMYGLSDDRITTRLLFVQMGIIR
jgi:ATP-dependent exoDNAse (exonuclease V) beta subunit